MLNESRLLFYYPFTALTVVFSHVIARPLLPTTRNDMALMDIVTGLFGRLDFVSSGLMSCNDSGEFTRLARATVERAIANHKGHLQDGGDYKRNPADLSSTSHASSSSHGRADSMTGGSNGSGHAPVGSGDTPLPSNSSFLGTSVAGTMPGTDVDSVGAMEYTLSGRDRVVEGANTLLAKHGYLEGSGDHWDMFTGFDWANNNTDGWPDMVPDYFQANLAL